MSKVQQIQNAIKALSEQKYARLRQWFSKRDWEQWDKEIEADSDEGKLDFLLEEACEERAKGKLKNL